ncbi:hypothetical protein [Labedella phragmitis]|uniref:hypothetical protein n=1 Tax=Labedella phragmitis TaxID=2498849 RepID=UPI001AA082A3|nr:hypothetical protein [Labedella phragmitis]
MTNRGGDLCGRRIDVAGDAVVVAALRVPHEGGHAALRTSSTSVATASGCAGVVECRRSIQRARADLAHVPIWVYVVVMARAATTSDVFNAAMLHGEHRGDPNAFGSVLTFESDGDATRIEMRTVFPTTELRDEAIEKHGAIEGGRQTLGNLADYVAELVRTGAID